MASLGDTLRAARERQGLTLEDAERECKVRRVFLEALEQERYDFLPPRAFAQGLLTVYARFLDLDPLPLIRMLPPDPEAETEIIAPPPAPPRTPWRIGVLAGVLLLAAAAGYAYIQAASPPPRDDRLLISLPTVSPTVEGGTVTPAATATPLATASPAATATVPPTATSTPGTPTATPSPTPVPPVAVPALTGQPLNQALAALQGVGLLATTEERFSAETPAGTVMEQRPAAGATLTRGDTIALVVSRGPPPLQVPNIVGRPEPDAKRMLIEAGLRPGQFTNYQGRGDLPPETLARVCSGCVLSSTPPPGTPVSPGSEVLLAVARY